MVFVDLVVSFVLSPFLVAFVWLLHLNYQNIFTIKKTWVTGLTSWICKGLINSQNLDIFPGYFSWVFLQRQILTSIITSENWSENLSNENKHSVFPVHFGILIHFLSWRQQKHQCLFLLLRFSDQFSDIIIDGQYLTS